MYSPALNKILILCDFPISSSSLEKDTKEYTLLVRYALSVGLNLEVNEMKLSRNTSNYLCIIFQFHTIP